MTDIVEMLRQGSLTRDDYRWKAADEITRLTAENEKLRAALRDVISSGLLHGPTTLSDEVLGTVHAALEEK